MSIHVDPSVVTGQSATLTVAAAGAAKVTGLIHSQPVSFKHQGGTWRATLHRGAELQPGLNLVEVDAGRSAPEGSTFTNIPVTGAPAPLGLTVQPSPGVQQVAITLDQPVASLTATVDGTPLSPPLDPTVLQQTASLGTADGLHQGSNPIEVTAVAADGRWQSASSDLTIGGGQPVAEAGADMTGRVGESTALDGGRSAPPAGAPAASLTEAWSVDRAPAGSTARLVGATTERPTFTPDLPGTYTFRLTARASDGMTGTDTVTLSARGYIPPIGTLIRTQAAPQPTTYSITRDGSAVVSIPQNLPGASMVAVYDRRTLEPLVVSSATADPAQVEANEVQPIRQAGNGPSGEGLLAVVSAAAGPGAPVAAVLGALGLQPDANMMAGNAFSVVVATGGGAAPRVWRSTKDSAAATAADPVGAGNLTGYFQPTNGGVGPFSFVSDTHLPFDSASSPAPTTNQVSIGCPGAGCLTLPSDALAACPGGQSPGGFQVAVVAESLVPVVNRTFTTNDGCTGPSDAAADTGAINGMIQLLAQYPANQDGTPDHLVVMQSIGSPRNVSTATQSGPWSAVTSAWLQMALAVVPYGGTTSVFANIGDVEPQGYTLVGSTALGLPGSSPTEAQEISADNPNRSAARVTGLLSRDQRNDLYLEVSTVGTAVNNQLGTVPYQPASPWPVSATPGEQAALSYITTITGPQLSPSVNPSSGGECWDPAHPSFRDAYCNLGLDWSRVSERLAALVGHPPRGPGAAGFTAADWDAVVSELAKETGQLHNATTLVNFLQAPFLRASQGVNLAGITTDVESSLTPSPAPPSSTATWLGFVSRTVGTLVPFVSTAGKPVVALFATYFSIAALLTTSADGQPLLGAPVRVKASDLGSELAERYQEASQNVAYLRDIFVTDSAKLNAITGIVERTGLTPVGLHAQEEALRVSAKGWLTSELLSSQFHPDLLSVSKTSLLDLRKPVAPYPGDASTFTCTNLGAFGQYSYQPFPGAGPQQQYSTLVAGPTAGSVVQNNYVLAAPGLIEDRYGEKVLPVAPTRVLSQLFAPFHPGSRNTGLGVYKPHFYSQDLGLASGTQQVCRSQHVVHEGPLAASTSSGLSQSVFFRRSGGQIQSGTTYSALTDSWTGMPILPGKADAGAGSAATSLAPGDLHLFFLQNGRLDNDWNDANIGDPSNPGPWHGPAGLPGNPDRATPLAATTPQPGAMQVFFVSKGDLQVDTWTVQSGWQGPRALPARPAAGSQLAAATAGGATYVFYSNANGSLSYVTHKPGQGDWSAAAPVSVGGQPPPASAGSLLATAAPGDGSIHLYFFASYNRGILLDVVREPDGTFRNEADTPPVPTTPGNLRGLASVGRGSLPLQVFFAVGDRLYLDSRPPTAAWTQTLLQGANVCGQTTC